MEEKCDATIMHSRINPGIGRFTNLFRICVYLRPSAVSKFRIFGLTRRLFRRLFTAPAVRLAEIQMVNLIPKLLQKQGFRSC